jgi:hypothetical protein
MPISARSRAVLAGLAIAGLLAAVTLAVHLMKPGQSSARWPEAQRSSFIDACNKNCRSAPGVTPDRYPLCDKACLCAVEEGEKVLSGEDLTQIYLAQTGGKPTEEQKEKVRKLTRISLACVAEALRDRK